MSLDQLVTKLFKNTHLKPQANVSALFGIRREQRNTGEFEALPEGMQATQGLRVFVQETVAPVQILVEEGWAQGRLALYQAPLL